MIVHIDKLIRHLRSQIESADKVDSEFVYLTKREAEGCLELAEAQDVIQEMLKEQDAKQVNISQTLYGMKYGLCPRCEKQIDTLVNPHYCGNCGQELKWE